MSDPTPSPETVRALLDRIAATSATGRFGDAQSNGQLGDVDGSHGYDPDQPRVPAGHPDGGQWTDKPGAGRTALRREAIIDRSGKEPWGSVANAYRGDGTLAEKRVFNRDGSRIVSEFNDGSAGSWDERHTVVMRDHSKVTFENSGDVQRVYDGDGRPIGASIWEDHGPEAVPKAQLAFLPQVVVGAAAGAAAARIAAQKTIEAALLLLTWLSSRNGPDRIAVMSFPAYVYERANAEAGTGANTEPFVRVDELTDEELGKICDKYVNVQKFTDVAAAKAKAERKRWSPQSFGNSVHARVACAVNGMTKDGKRCRSPSDPEDPDFRAELSAVKAQAEEPTAPVPDRKAELPNPDVEPRYGQRGTIRVDVFEKASKDMVCVYDIKTGNARLTLARIKEIIGSVFERFKGINKIVIAQVRPR